MSKHFTKISGYKVVNKCRNCGKKVESKTETYYCDACLDRLRDYRHRSGEQ